MIGSENHPVAETPPLLRHRVNALQVLRFIAASLVLVGHMQHELSERAAFSPGSAGAWTFVPFDWGLGVDIFFVISGFVMYYLTADGFGRKGGPADFLRRRLVRIAPLYWIFSAAMLAALYQAARGGGPPLPSSANILFSFLFLPGPQCADYCFPIYTLGWTLNYEMLFYALFAVGLFFPKRIGLGFIFGALVALMAARAVAPAEWTMLRFWGYPMTGEFLAGIVLAGLFRRGARIPAGLAMAIIGAAMALAVFFYQTDAYEVVSRLFTGGLPAAMIVGASVLGLEPRKLNGFQSFLVAGGNASYALYLSHPFSIKISAALLARMTFLPFSPPLFLLFTFIIAILGGFATHHVIERPLLKLFHRRTAIPAADDASIPRSAQGAQG